MDMVKRFDPSYAEPDDRTLKQTIGVAENLQLGSWFVDSIANANVNWLAAA